MSRALLCTGPVSPALGLANLGPHLTPNPLTFALILNQTSLCSRRVPYHHGRQQQLPVRTDLLRLPVLEQDVGGLGRHQLRRLPHNRQGILFTLLLHQNPPLSFAYAAHNNGL